MRDKVRKQNITLYQEEQIKKKVIRSQHNQPLLFSSIISVFLHPPASVKFYASKNSTEFADQQLQWTNREVSRQRTVEQLVKQV